jgi:hypothetical protein
MATKKAARGSVVATPSDRGRERSPERDTTMRIERLLAALAVRLVIQKRKEQQT